MGITARDPLEAWIAENAGLAWVRCTQSSEGRNSCSFLRWPLLCTQVFIFPSFSITHLLLSFLFKQSLWFLNLGLLLLWHTVFGQFVFSTDAGTQGMYIQSTLSLNSITTQQSFWDKVLLYVPDWFWTYCDVWGWPQTHDITSYGLPSAMIINVSHHITLFMMLFDDIYSWN